MPGLTRSRIESGARSACERSQALELLAIVDDDPPDASAGRGCELFVRFAAAVHHDARCRKAGAFRGEQFAQRTDVERERGCRQTARERDDQERLSGVCDVDVQFRTERGEARRRGVENVAVDDEQGRAVGCRQRFGRDAAERRSGALSLHAARRANGTTSAPRCSGRRIRARDTGCCRRARAGAAPASPSR